MKKGVLIRGLCILLSAFLLMTVGCGDSDNPSESSAPEVTTQAGSDSEKDKTTAPSSADQTTAENPSEENPTTAPGEEKEDTGYDENGMPILTSKVWRDGKLAVFFFHGDNDWSAAETGEHAGESILFITPGGTTVLVDADTPNNGADIVNNLQKIGIKKIDYFINSHPHVDHIGGFSVIARYFDIGEIIIGDIPIIEEGLNTPYFRNMMSVAERKGIKITKVLAGATLKLGDITGKVFNPTTDFDPNVSNYNESSLAIKFTWKNASFLLCGDCGDNESLGQKTESIIVSKYGSELKADIAKLNHHGEPSTHSQSAGWLSSVNAKAYIGCMSNIPNDVEYFRLFKAFKNSGAQFLHTGIDGSVLFTTSGDGTYDVYVEKNRPTDYYGTLKLENGHMTIK